jgi:hypothetical protein
MSNIHKDSLAHGFSLSIGICCRKKAHLFIERYSIVTIDRSGRTEDKLMDSMPDTRIRQYHGADQVVIVIGQRLLYRLSYSFKSCKMYHPVNPVFRKYILHSISISNVDFIKLKVLSGNLFYPIQRIFLAVA